MGSDMLLECQEEIARLEKMIREWNPSRTFIHAWYTSPIHGSPKLPAYRVFRDQMRSTIKLRGSLKRMFKQEIRRICKEALDKCKYAGKVELNWKPIRTAQDIIDDYLGNERPFRFEAVYTLQEPIEFIPLDIKIEDLGK